MHKPNHKVALGNEAIARGLVEAGVDVVTGYPGTPSSEIIPEIIALKKEFALNTYVEWSVNEKVAFEVALAASWARKRAAVTMKQVGLNVASDPLLNSAYSGVVGGLLLIVCDDPGAYSSQTEQDTRLFALFAKIPVFDPATPRQAKELIPVAFELSEKYRIPVILRSSLRVSHARQNISLEPIIHSARHANFVKDPTHWAATPRLRVQLHQELNDKLARIEQEFETSPFNFEMQASKFEIGHTAFKKRKAPSQRSRTKIRKRKFPLGILAAGVPAATAQELLQEFDAPIPLLQISTVYPLPQKRIAEFLASCERVLTLEEPDAAMETQLPDRRAVLGRLDGTVPNAGELTPDIIAPILARLLHTAGLRSETPETALPAWHSALEDLKLPARGPRLCPGCGHRSAFYTIRRTFPGAFYTSDIGCYTLGINLRAVDTVVDMGAAITIASGLYQAYRLDNKTKPIVATIGDSTFIHSGVTGLANAVHTGARFILVILDNSTTAMTGFQPTAHQTQLADGAEGARVGIPDLARACGVKFLRTADPYELDAFQHILKQADEFTRAPDGGIAVIIAQRPCVLNDRSPIDAQPIRVEVTDECDGCKYCLVAFECPALVMNVKTNKVEINYQTCVDCGQCIDSCYKGFIVESKPMTILELAEKVGSEKGQVA
ncbi:MAG: indolepyruvate oxidoreductase subunit IorA [Chloroflexota bacterium]|nr:MAG: indolepyruvate oxidoreductase subunit IorA [Chloroflexota bacterium]